MDQHELFLCKPIPQGGNCHKWLAECYTVPPQTAINMFRKPEPYLTTAYRASLITLRLLGYDAQIIEKKGFSNLQYVMPSGGTCWIRIPQPRNRSTAVQQIMGDLLKGFTVYARYQCREHEKLADPMWINNALRLVPDKANRTYKRYWRDFANENWISTPPYDDDLNIDEINSAVHTGVFTSEFDAANFVDDWLEKSRVLCS
jgi:hypothetical protein